MSTASLYTLSPSLYKCGKKTHRQFHYSIFFHGKYFTQYIHTVHHQNGHTVLYNLIVDSLVGYTGGLLMPAKLCQETDGLGDTNEKSFMT